MKESEQMVTREVIRCQRVLREHFLEAKNELLKARETIIKQKNQITDLTRKLSLAEQKMQEMRLYVDNMNHNLKKESFKIREISEHYCPGILTFEEPNFDKLDEEAIRGWRGSVHSRSTHRDATCPCEVRNMNEI